MINSVGRGARVTYTGETFGDHLVHTGRVIDAWYTSTGAFYLKVRFGCCETILDLPVDDIHLAR